jgi:hypothetical protein
MESLIKSLLENELLRAELIAVGLLLLLLLIKSLGVNIGNFGYVSVLVLLVVPILWFIGKWLVGLVKQINIPKVPIWLWVAIALLTLVIIFWKKIPGIKKPEKITGGLIWKVLGVIAIILIGYYIYYEWQDYKTKKLSWKPNVVIGDSDKKDPLIGSPYLKMDGENFMEKGQFFQFDINWDDPDISFDPQTSEKVVLYFQKAEDPTRKWRLVLWKNKQGKKEHLFSPSVPIAKALVGRVYVKSEISSVKVVVSRK